MPNLTNTTFQFFWTDRSVHKRFRAGVSLHSHTMHSEESLEMLPRYIGNIPVVCRSLNKQIDYSRAFWTPPLSPRQAHRVEEKQIQRRFQLPALVSLTDHDNIQAGLLLCVLDRYRNAPVSTEWTVPFGPTIFHVGIHNLPRGEAIGLMEEFRQFTAKPNCTELGRLLSKVASHKEVLVVFNHPLWDEERIGIDNHLNAATDLLKQHGRYIHALELNGLRTWAENQRVIKLGQQTGMPVISGGDRHGREPNAIVNLTCATTLPEFIDEVRSERKSHVVFMPQYRESLNLRTMQTVIDVLRDYPEVFEGRRTWPERVYFRHPGAETAVPLSSMWSKEEQPAIFKAVSLGVAVSQWGVVQNAVRLVWRGQKPDWGRMQQLPTSRALEIESEIAI